MELRPPARYHAQPLPGFGLSRQPWREVVWDAGHQRAGGWRGVFSAADLTACSTARSTLQSGRTGNSSPATEPELGPYTSKFPYLQYILQMSNMYRSHYNAVQASLTQRTSHGLSFTAAYTYSHGTDDVSQNFGSTTPLNNLAPDAFELREQRLRHPAPVHV